MAGSYPAKHEKGREEDDVDTLLAFTVPRKRKGQNGMG